MRIAPCSVKEAKRWVREYHRHLKRIQGGLFAAKVVDAAGQTRGVAIAGFGPRAWNGTGRLVITRVSSDGARNACSALYGAMCRAGKALGYREAWTYTLPGEPGTSLRAAGFIFMGETDGGEHDRPSRRRAPAIHPEPKSRWMRVLSAEAEAA